MLEIKVNTLNQEDFEPYGEVIGGPQKTKPAISDSVIDFWPGVSDLEASEDIYQLNWLEVKGAREFVYEQMERHVNTSETLIPVKGQAIIAFALSKDPEDSNSPIDDKTIKAFFFDGTKSINLKKGVWHGLPCPLSDKANFIVVFQKQTHNDDMEIVDLEQKIKVNL